MLEFQHFQHDTVSLIIVDDKSYKVTDLENLYASLNLRSNIQRLAIVSEYRTNPFASIDYMFTYKNSTYDAIKKISDYQETKNKPLDLFIDITYDHDIIRTQSFINIIYSGKYKHITTILTTMFSRQGKLKKLPPLITHPLRYIFILPINNIHKIRQFYVYFMHIIKFKHLVEMLTTMYYDQKILVYDRLCKQFYFIGLKNPEVILASNSSSTVRM